MFKGTLTKHNVITWLNSFQKKVNALLATDRLQFTAEVWGKGKEDGIKHEKVKAIEKDTFPFLDMEMSWSEGEKLLFGVHLKENQALKYLNADSQHTRATFKAIPSGVLKRLLKLTTITEQNGNQTIDEIYPAHAEALTKAKLISDFPTLKDLKRTLETGKTNTNQPKEKKRSRQTYFCIGITNIWTEKIHRILTTIRKKFDLKWLRISMSYHKFSNLREMFSGDLTTKLLSNIGSEDFLAEKCNCNAASKVNGCCIFKGKCRHKIVIYKATCKICSKFYIGSTQNATKSRIGGHNQEVRRLANCNIKSDSYAKHFASHFKAGEVTVGKVREILDVDILWEGNPISVCKSFGKDSCSLCMKERILILRENKKDRCRVINTNNEMYGACRHKPRFHRLIKKDIHTECTDEAEPAENGQNEEARANARTTVFV